MFEILLSSGAAAAAILGGYALHQKFAYGSHRVVKLLVPVTAGFLLGVVAFSLFPEASELSNSREIFVWILGGFLALLVIENFVVLHACQEDDHHKLHTHATGTSAGIGFFVHSAIDGMAIGTGFEVSSSLGLIATLAVLLHKLPVGILLPCIFTHGKLSPRATLNWVILIAFATPIGAMITYIFARNLEAATLGKLLAIAAGSFLYIAATDLIPQTRKTRGWKPVLLILAGIAVAWLTSSITLNIF